MSDCGMIRRALPAPYASAMLRSLNRWLEANRWIGDAVIATALLATMPLAYQGSTRGELLFSALLILPLYARRSLPRTVTVTVAALCLLQLFLLPRPVLGDVAALFVVHAATAHVQHRGWGIGAWAAAVTGAAAAAVLWFGAADPSNAVVAFASGFGAVSAAYLLGARQRDRREHVDEQLTALQERNRLLAIERDQRAEMAATQERTTIARELHDIVAHSLTVIVVQADGAAAAVRAAPDRADIAPMVLDTIAATSREALAEMRRLVGVLRSGAAPRPSSGTGVGTAPVQQTPAAAASAARGDAQVAYAPSPGVEELAALVEQVAGTGLPVTLTVSGPKRPLPAALGLTVYRVVQESLTNVLRHGGPAACAGVELLFTPTHLLLKVIDTGRGAAAVTADPDGGGHGLLGMRERVRVHDGVLQAGPRQSGGFEVWVELPLPPLLAAGSVTAPTPAMSSWRIDGAR